ncbi:YhcH/YjgK/YiaL family protein [Paludibacterium yongneupense]|uniref:YhcH/YjgK/YiaL family protein n=1 Tax=Paludibacterium yongneupense TaxID=400061 RepID=UPI0004024F0C|nr:YhcH/YjgK/YiaL family protein [Paludibacterium yongneupense]
MIFDHIAHFGRGASPMPLALQRAFDWLHSIDAGQLAVGRHAIDGDNIYAMVQEMDTRPDSEGHPEAHRRYIDVQYLVSGSEKIGFLPRGTPARLLQDKLEANDIAFYDSDAAETSLLLTPGMAAVFFPGELHRPCLAVDTPQALRKIVIKIDVRMLNAV